MPAWLHPLGEPSGLRLLQWEQARADECLADVFGYHALQAGWPGYDALRANRMPQRWHARQEFDDWHPAHQLDFDSRAWPLPSESLDLIALPHTLERSGDAHTCLREAARVLIPDGHLLITGLNPWSLWGRQFLRHQARALDGSLGPWPLEPIGLHRLRDWLRLLGFEVRLVRQTGWAPAWRTEAWVQRWRFMDTVGQRWLPFWGGAYLVLATKRVPGVHLLKAKSWSRVPSRTRLAAPAASLEAPLHHNSLSHDSERPL